MSDIPIKFPPCVPGLGIYPIVPDLPCLMRFAHMPCMKKQWIQLRIKNEPLVMRRNVISQAARMAQQQQLCLFINDDWQLALECALQQSTDDQFRHGIYGVHLGQEDLRTLNKCDFSALAKLNIHLGVSVYTLEGLPIALHSMHYVPSYIALGAVFATRSKSIATSLLGLEQLKQAVQRAMPYPTIAIGGITLNNVAGVWATGVNGVALIQDLLNAHDVEKRMQQHQATFLNRARSILPLGI